MSGCSGHRWSSRRGAGAAGFHKERKCVAPPARRCQAPSIPRAYGEGPRAISALEVEAGQGKPRAQLHVFGPPAPVANGIAVDTLNRSVVEENDATEESCPRLAPRWAVP